MDRMHTNQPAREVDLQNGYLPPEPERPAEIRRRRTRSQERQLKATRSRDLLSDDGLVLVASMTESILRALEMKRRWNAVTYMLLGASILAVVQAAVTLALY